MASNEGIVRIFPDFLGDTFEGCTCRKAVEWMRSSLASSTLEKLLVKSGKAQACQSAIPDYSRDRY